MRADRLIAILMLLQSRGRMTARELAEELEVTERTVYRDINALCYSGVPIFTERGPGGGISLIERYRSDLTGLTRKEVQALFMLTIPPALGDLGLDHKLKAALQKLSAALPSAFRGDERLTRQTIHLDPVPWESKDNAPSKAQIQLIHQAIRDSFELDIRYLTFITHGYQSVQSVVHPFGLVAKSMDWYMVAKRRNHMLVLRVDRVQNVRFTGNTFERPLDFDLKEFWKQWRHENDLNRPSYPVIVRVSPDLAKDAGYFLSKRLRNIGEPDETGWVVLELNFEYFEQARSELLHFGGAVEVQSPVALKHSIRDFAEQILSVYQSYV